MIFIDCHRHFWLPVIRIVHAKLFAIPGDPKDHELPWKFGAIGILEEMDPPPPVPSTVCKHIFRISLPYVTEYLVHVNPTESFRVGTHQRPSQINDITPFQSTNDASHFLSH